MFKSLIIIEKRNIVLPFIFFCKNHYNTLLQEAFKN